MDANVLGKKKTSKFYENVAPYRAKAREIITSAIGVGLNIKLIEPKTLARSEGKAKRVIDNRKI